MGYLVGIFLIIYYIVSVFNGNGDVGMLVAAGLFMISGSIDVSGTWIKSAIEKNDPSVKAGQILGTMMQAFNKSATDKKEDK